MYAQTVMVPKIEYRLFRAGAVNKNCNKSLASPPPHYVSYFVVTTVLSTTCSCVSAEGTRRLLEHGAQAGDPGFDTCCFGRNPLDEDGSVVKRLISTFDVV